MPMTRRARSTSTSAAVDAFRKANATIQWPVEIDQLDDPRQAQRAMGAFKKVLAARSPDDWTAAAVLIAARWAKTLVAADDLSAEVARQGYTIPSPKNPAQLLRNPNLDALSQLNQMSLALSRMLQLAGGADRRTLGNNRRAVEAAAAAMADGRNALLAGYSDEDAEDLLARAVSQ